MMTQITFPITAGALIRGQFKRELKKWCFRYDYQLEIDEDKGWFESLLNITIHVPDEEVNEASKALYDYFKKVATTEVN